MTMEAQDNSQVESTEVSEQVEGAESQTTEEQGNPAETGDKLAADASAAAIAQPNPYTPNFKFKVLDKELEIPEKFRALLKDADTEKEVREIFEKAHGIDFVKEKNQQLRQRFEPIEKEFKQVKSEIETAQNYLKKGDMKSFVDYLKLPKDMIFKYVLDELNYKDLTPEQRAEYDRSRELAQQNETQEKKIQEYEQRYQEAAEKQLETEFNMVAMQPENAELANTYDSMAGKPGSFKQAVAMHALTVFTNTGKHLDPAAAIQSFKQLYGAALKPQSAAQQQIIPPAGQQVVSKQPPVIPNVSGSGAGSPVKQKPKTLDDLRKLSAQKNREANPIQE